MPNMVVTTSKNRKPSYKGCVSELNNVAKWQLVDHFYDDDGKRNKKAVAYFGIDKTARAPTLSEIKQKGVSAKNKKGKR